MIDIGIYLKFGSTRLVIVAGSLAFKLPRFTHWKTFLRGLLANIQECEFNTLKDPLLCPIYFSLPGGFLVVMPRVSPIKTKLSTRKFNSLVDRNTYILPIENKIDSFGYLGDILVAIDYGS